MAISGPAMYAKNTYCKCLLKQGRLLNCNGW